MEHDPGVSKRRFQDHSIALTPHVSEPGKPVTAFGRNHELGRVRGWRVGNEGRKASTAGPDRPTHEPPTGQCLEREIPAGECLRAGGLHDVGKPILGLARRLES